MASATAYRLKRNWMKMPAESFETLTFGDLEVGQNFIAFPLPGDNDGHGGFKGTHYIFTKELSSVSEKTLFGKLGKRNVRLPGTAINGKGTTYNFPDSMPVILVE